MCVCVCVCEREREAQRVCLCFLQIFPWLSVLVSETTCAEQTYVFFKYKI